MSDDDFRLNEAINRIKKRIDRIRVLKNHMESEIDSMIAEAQADIKSLQLQLDANRVAGTSKDTKQVKKRS